MIEIGSCAIRQPHCVLISHAPLLLTWSPQPLPRKVTDFGFLTEHFYACRINRSMGNSNCLVKPTAFMIRRSANTCASGWRQSMNCGAKDQAFIAENSVPLTSPRSDKAQMNKPLNG